MSKSEIAMTLVQAKISQRDHRILKMMAAENGTTIAEYMRTAVCGLIESTQGKDIARRLLSPSRLKRPGVA